MSDKVDEGKHDVDDPTDKDGKHPETVSWTQYVGIKESSGKKLETANQKIATLEEQAKGTVTKEEHSKIKADLETANTAAKKAADDLTASKESTLKEKRDVLVKKGIAEDKLTNMSSEQLDSLLEVSAALKPGADMDGGGGGASNLKGMSPLKLATMGYEQNKK